MQLTWQSTTAQPEQPLFANVQIEQAEYDTFFKTTFREFLEPLAQNHFNVEGTIEFSALLFVPGMAPFEQQVRTCPPCCWNVSVSLPSADIGEAVLYL